MIDPAYQNIEQSDFGAFLQVIQNLQKETTLTAGIRYDVLDLFDNQFSYRLGLTHEFNQQFASKLLFGTAYRSPSTLEFARSAPGQAIPQPETLQTAEMQIRYTPTLKSLYTLSLFHNRYEDFINRLENFGNTGEQKVFGAELESQLEFASNWRGFLNLAWQRSRDQQSRDIPLLADWTASLGIDWYRAFDQHGLHLRNELIVYGDRQDWYDDFWVEGVTTRLDNREADLVDGFAVWNAVLQYSIYSGVKDSLQLTLNVRNVLDTTYYTQSSQVPNPNRAVFFDTEHAGRELYLSLDYRW